VTARPRSEEGSTLVEVIISVVILGIVTAGLLAGMTTTTASSNLARDQANAEIALTSVAQAVTDAALYPFQCSDFDYDLVPGFPTLPNGWTATIRVSQIWDGNGFVPYQPNQCKGMQELTIQVSGPNGRPTWSRVIVKAAPADGGPLQ
jgi:type II secretory pathway pseudopilin PulG